MVIVKVKLDAQPFFSEAMFSLFDVCNNDSYVISGMLGLRACS